MWTPGVRAHYLARVQRAMQYLEQSQRELNLNREPSTSDILRSLFAAATETLDTLDMVVGSYKRSVAAAAATAIAPGKKGATAPAAGGTSSKQS